MKTLIALIFLCSIVNNINAQTNNFNAPIQLGNNNKQYNTFLKEKRLSKKDKMAIIQEIAEGEKEYNCKIKYFRISKNTASNASLFITDLREFLVQRGLVAFVDNVSLNIGEIHDGIRLVFSPKDSIILFEVGIIK